MGRLNLNKQNLSALIPYQIGVDIYLNNFYTFKSATTNLLGTVFNPSLFNSPYSDIINITPPNQAQETFLFDGSTWVYTDLSTNANNYIIPNDSLIQIATDNISSVPVGGGAIIQKYYNGKINIGKQNLTTLKSSTYYPEAVYTFISPASNTLANIFNPNQFSIAFADQLTINNQTFYVQDQNTWTYNDYSTNANNYIIPINSTLEFQTSTNLSISVGGGAIIQKSNSGKININ